MEMVHWVAEMTVGPQTLDEKEGREPGARVMGWHARVLGVCDGDVAVDVRAQKVETVDRMAVLVDEKEATPRKVDERVQAADERAGTSWIAGARVVEVRKAGGVQVATKLVGARKAVRREACD